MPKTYQSIKQKQSKSKGFDTRQNTITNLVIGAATLLVLILIGWAIYKNQNQAAEEPTGQPTVKQYASAPEMMIDVTKQYFATVTMDKGGEFVIQLFPDKAPITVNSFVFLAKDHFFDGVTFHRVLEGFMAQAGDPTGTGRSGPGYSFVNEDSDLSFDKEGVVAMANAGRDTNGSQFFITFGPTPHLNGGYTIFGQVISGMNVVNNLTRRNPNENPSYTGDVIRSITIEEK